MLRLRELQSEVTVILPGYADLISLYQFTQSNQTIVLPPLHQVLGMELELFKDEHLLTWVESVEQNVIRIPGEPETTKFNLFKPVTRLVGFPNYWLVI